MDRGERSWNARDCSVAQVLHPALVQGPGAIQGSGHVDLTKLSNSARVQEVLSFVSSYLSLSLSLYRLAL